MVWLPLWPDELPELAGYPEEGAVPCCAAIHAVQARKVMVSKIVFVICESSCSLVLIWMTRWMADWQELSSRRLDFLDVSGALETAVNQPVALSPVVEEWPHFSNELAKIG